MGYHSQIFLHFIWRKTSGSPILTDHMFGIMRENMRTRCEKLGMQFITVGGYVNHAHLLVRIRPDHLISHVIGQIKGSATREINKSGVNSKHFSWEKGYAVYSVCPYHVDRIIRYIKNQKKHHESNRLIQRYEKFD